MNTRHIKPSNQRQQADSSFFQPSYFLSSNQPKVGERKRRVQGKESERDRERIKEKGKQRDTEREKKKNVKREIQRERKKERDRENKIN